MSDIKIPLEPPPAYDADSEHTPLVAGAPAPLRQKLPVRSPLPLELPALQKIRGKRVILASASPRRKQLLAQVRPQAANLGRSRLTIAAPLDWPHEPRDYPLDCSRRPLQIARAIRIRARYSRTKSHERVPIRD